MLFLVLSQSSFAEENNDSNLEALSAAKKMICYDPNHLDNILQGSGKESPIAIGIGRAGTTILYYSMETFAYTIVEITVIEGKEWGCILTDGETMGFHKDFRPSIGI